MQWNAVMLWICIGLDSRKWTKFFVVLYFANIRDKSDSISEYPLRRSLEKDLFVFFLSPCSLNHCIEAFGSMVSKLDTAAGDRREREKKQEEKSNWLHVE